MKVTIDPGHGGTNIGALNGLENSLNLDVAKAAVKALSAIGLDVNLTRDTEKTVYWYDRKHATTGSDLVISVHHNAWRDPVAHGLMLFHWPGNEAVARACEESEPYIPPELYRPKHTVPADDKYPSAKFICGYYPPPTVLVECCFLTNERDLDFTGSTGYFERMGLFIANLALCYGEVANDR